MLRFHQAVLACSLFALSWLLMQAIHECGHVVAAWLTGGAVTKVVLHPLRISRTDVEPNPRPLIVAWGGPVIGGLVPIIGWAIAAMGRLQTAFLLRFFAGFCLLANGVYLGIGSFGGVGDAGDILRLGGPIWMMWLFGLLTAPTGLALWNGLGPEFGFGASEKTPVAALTAGICAALAIVVAAQWLFFGK